MVLASPTLTLYEAVNDDILLIVPCTSKITRLTVVASPSRVLKT